MTGRDDRGAALIFLWLALLRHFWYVWWRFEAHKLCPDLVPVALSWLDYCVTHHACIVKGVVLRWNAVQSLVTCGEMQGSVGCGNLCCVPHNLPDQWSGRALEETLAAECSIVTCPKSLLQLRG
jgi:hypothetical protein